MKIEEQEKRKERKGKKSNKSSGKNGIIKRIQCNEKESKNYKEKGGEKGVKWPNEVPSTCCQRVVLKCITRFYVLHNTIAGQSAEGVLRAGWHCNLLMMLNRGEADQPAKDKSLLSA